MAASIMSERRFPPPWSGEISHAMKRGRLQPTSPSCPTSRIHHDLFVTRTNAAFQYAARLIRLIRTLLGLIGIDASGLRGAAPL